MKKKSILRAVLTAVLSLVATIATAHDFEVDGIYYNDNCDGTVSVTYKGSSYNEYTNEYTGDVTIPSSVTYSGTTYSVTSIGDKAFGECSGLTSVSIPNSVTSIGNYAFAFCSGLTSVTIPNSVTSIGKGDFKGCSGLTSVTIPNSVTSIGDKAFEDCSGLISVTIPNSVTSILGNAFAGCSGLESIVVESGNSKYDSRDNCNAIIETATNTLLAGCKNTTIPNSVTSIGYRAFRGCSGLTSVTIPNSVSSIGDSAFSGCSGLTSVTIPNSVSSIGDFAFSGCSGLTSVTIPNSVTSIGNDAFYSCSGLTSITIGNSVSSIGNFVFEDCSGLKSIVVESGNSKYDSRDNCNAIIETATNTLLAGCKNTTIPNSVTSIGYGAFNGCSGLTSASIPNSVTYIGEYAFWDCSSLKKAIVKAITPPYIASKSFNNYDLKLIVPAISKEEYKSANIWSSFTNYADAEIMITALGLEKNNASIKSGETIQLTATATPADATFADVFLWTSGNEDVATVDGNGVVTAIADGTATITASTVDGSNITAACVVSVGAGAVEGVDTAAARIYTADGNIIIAAAEDGEAAVYDFTGHLIKSVPVASGNSTAVPVTPGYYIVKTGTKTQSVVVK
ncbi:MAG: leucine-rich repeat protein [Bacteroidales bacterium]|nr:leucine-rich repeat protein [Bacteroidales bacterium]